MENAMGMVSRNRAPCIEVLTRIRHNSSITGSIEPTGLNTNPKGGNRLWRMQWAWFREIDVLKNENLNFDNPEVKIRPNSSETIPIVQTGFDTSPKGGNRPWRMQWAWFREIDVLNKEKCMDDQEPSYFLICKYGFSQSDRRGAAFCAMSSQSWPGELWNCGFLHQIA